MRQESLDSGSGDGGVSDRECFQVCQGCEVPDVGV